MPRKPIPKVVERRADGKIICGAKKRKGGICQALAMPNGRCRIHGGKTPAGADSPNYKHGRYSQQVPRHLLDNYQSALSDPDRLSLDHEAALLTIRIQEKLQALELLKTPPWETVLSLFRVYLSKKEESVLKLLGSTLEEGHESALAHKRTWEDIQDLIQDKTKVVGAEAKRLSDLQNMIPLAQAIAFAMSFATAARECITDPFQLRKFLTRVKEILPAESQPEISLAPSPGEFTEPVLSSQGPNDAI